jgi:5,10-methylenetetrahydromethanopterin reductase
MERHLALSTDFAAPDIVAAATAAEEAGYDAVWLTDVRFQRECVTLLGAIAASTSRIGLATGVNDPFSRHPAALAAVGATLAELGPGRVTIGLGSGGSGLASIGVTKARPLAAVAAAIATLRGLWAGERVSVDAPGFLLEDGALQFAVPHPPAIALVAHGPRMYELAGRLADDVIVANYLRPDAIEWAREQVRRGAERRAPGLAPPREVLRTDICVAADAGAARDVLRRRIASLLRSGYYSAGFLAPLGLSPDRPELDAVLDAVALTGTPAAVTERVRALRERCGLAALCCRVYAAPGQTLDAAVREVAEVLAAA